jgi:hypothetical protein
MNCDVLVESAKATGHRVKNVWLLMANIVLLLVLSGCVSLLSEHSDAKTGTHFNPAGLYEDSVLLGNESRLGSMDGFRVFDVSITHQGARLPEGVSVDMLYQGDWIGDIIDKDGTLPVGYEYIFITYRLTNETNNSAEFKLNSATLYVLGSGLEVLDGGWYVCYLNGKDLAAAEIAKDKQIAQETLALGESGTYTVAFFAESDIISKGSLYFIPDNTIGVSEGNPLLPYQAIRVESLAAQ